MEKAPKWAAISRLLGVRLVKGQLNNREITSHAKVKMLWAVIVNLIVVWLLPADWYAVPNKGASALPPSGRGMRVTELGDAGAGIAAAAAAVAAAAAAAAAAAVGLFCSVYPANDHYSWLVGSQAETGSNRLETGSKPDQETDSVNWFKPTWNRLQSAQ